MNTRLLLASIGVFLLTFFTWVKVAQAAWAWSSEDSYFCFEQMCDCEESCSQDCAEGLCRDGCENEPEPMNCYAQCAIDASDAWYYMCC